MVVNLGKSAMKKIARSLALAAAFVTPGVAPAGGLMKRDEVTGTRGDDRPEAPRVPDLTRGIPLSVGPAESLSSAPLQLGGNE